MRHFDIDFLIFLRNFVDFFRNDFPNSLIVLPRSSLLVCLVIENSLNCTSGLVLLCFFFNSLYLLITFYISHDFHAWLLTYLTHCFNWMDSKFFHALNYAFRDLIWFPIFSGLLFSMTAKLSCFFNQLNMQFFMFSFLKIFVEWVFDWLSSQFREVWRRQYFSLCFQRYVFVVIN